MRPPKPVTLPAIALPDVDDADERREAAERAAVTRTIRTGRDCWERLGDSNSFTAWTKIGAALAILKTRALKETGANIAWGSAYSKALSKLMAEFGFGAMRPSDRSHAITLHENLEAIERWRATLPDKERRRLRRAQQNVKRWRRETTRSAPPDGVAAALAAWRLFVGRVKGLPAEQAATVWQAVAAEAAAHA